MMISLSVMMIILRSWWWLARKKHENEKPLGADSVEYWSLQRSGENGIFFLRTISNIYYNSNTKINLCVNYVKYFLPLKHKKIKTQIFSQTQNHNLLFAKYYKYSQQFKHRIMQYFRHKKITKSVQEWIFFRWNSLCWHESCLWEGSQKSFYSLWM